MTRQDRRWAITLMAGITIPYLLMAYGGVRSPDCEVVFRTGESLAHHGTLEVSRRLEAWPDFGVAKGKDGRLYAIFGPELGVLVAPLVRLGDALEHSAWFQHSRAWIPISFFVGNGMTHYFQGTRPDDMRPHLLRFLGALINIVGSAAAATTFGLIALRVSHARSVATVMAVLLGLGTLAWPYSGTFFSEPMATLFALMSFYMLISMDPAHGPESHRRTLRLAASGIFLGLSVLAHITSVLFVPFFAAYAHGIGRRRGGRKEGMRFALAWAIGCGVMLALLGYYNASRFGSPLETGRTADMAIYTRLEYGRFVAPWQGLPGLLFSSGKGLFWYSPAVLLGLAAWPRFHRTNPMLSTVLATMAGTRLLFLASRSDWHGGFCLGPRYLVPLIPFLLLPIVPVLADGVARRARARVGTVVLCLFVGVSQQAFFSLGEPISYYYAIRMNLWDNRVLDLFKDNLLYRDWRFSPLIHLLDWRRGPFLLQGIPLSNVQLWLGFTGLAALLSLAAYQHLLRPPAERHASGKTKL